MTLKLARGDCYRIPFEGVTREYTFVKQVAGGQMIFVDGTTGRPVPFDEGKLSKMIKDRAAVRQLSSNWVDRIDIHALMDPSLPKTPLETRKKIHAAQVKVAEAAMLLFYVKRFDAAPDEVSRSNAGYTAFIDRTYPAAEAAGHFHKPSYSALRRALEKGVPHNRCLADYISQRGAHSKRKWTDPWVLRRLKNAVDEFYSEGIPKPPTLKDVVDKFLGDAILEDRARQQRGESSLKYPRRTAVEDHIRGQETEERLAKREPRRALQEYGGRAKGASADFPLQRVQIDQTLVDTWINIYDEDGNIEDRRRPWLVSIFDVYSRMILAAILTFEKPSALTVQLAIKQMLRPKLFLIERFGKKKGATDGSGMPKEMTFDNGVENIGFSSRTLLADSGIDMELAPKGTPKAKAIVERGFNTYNHSLWHNAPGGIPYKPQALAARRLKPEEKAQWALDFATGVMWHWIVNVHHLGRNRTLEGIPARLWSEKVNDAMVGRSVPKRLDLFDILCGIRKRLWFNGAGVAYDTHVFHHKDVTEDFLRATLPAEMRSSRRKGGKVAVEAIIYPHDCSHIYIVDHVRNRFVRLPNSKPRFAEGLSYNEARLIREADRRLDRHFVSEEELILAKCEFLRLRDRARDLARAERAILQARKANKKVAAEGELVVYTLAEGDDIEMGTVDPTINGDAPYDIPQEMPAIVRKSPLVSHKDQQRGARKAQETRQKNKLIDELRKAASASVRVERPANARPHALPIIDDASSFLDALADDLD
ncbi:transposase family protein [Rhizobium sp. CB3090]|uniref:integrase catalytic domain-containing protein n=1 Tax=Rhizobium sp. CB3090 TaxID=3039156 RepID=UPI0024B0C331|nr:transposase family protein [Rhizobium sp. CB3090]WFU10890.1 transposase family protein [Rhizobium sp. CB3090]